MATSKNSLLGLYVDELRDIYNAEKQLTRALPKMAKGASSDKLREGFVEHLEQTKGHVDRLEQIFDALGERSSGKKCAGMEGLVEEGAEVPNGGSFAEGVEQRRQARCFHVQLREIEERIASAR